ncbi:MAG: hypothetical protein O9346_17830 [Leptospiraceae bacterium]|nr:hypothetical protein [Leptospiraceae bacterium]MCZ8348276.1 hypothetical protein [Leptospiraceae bacterium]
MAINRIIKNNEILDIVMSENLDDYDMIKLLDIQGKLNDRSISEVHLDFTRVTDISLNFAGVLVALHSNCIKESKKLVFFANDVTKLIFDKFGLKDFFNGNFRECDKS